MATLYETSVPLRGDPSRALDSATSILVGASFRIAERSRSAVLFEGPGMNNNRENPLVGASRVEIEAGKGRLCLRAELGGVDRLVKGVILLIAGLAVVIGIPSSLALYRQMGLTIVALSLGPFVPWLFILPWLRYYLRRRTRRALDVLLHNAAMLGAEMPAGSK